MLEGCAWNESYLLRAFLQYNSRFELLLFFDYPRRFHGESLGRLLLDWQATGYALGSSSWLKKSLSP